MLIAQKRLRFSLNFLKFKNCRRYINNTFYFYKISLLQQESNSLLLIIYSLSLKYNAFVMLFLCFIEILCTLCASLSIILRLIILRLLRLLARSSNISHLQHLRSRFKVGFICILYLALKTIVLALAISTCTFKLTL